MIQIYGDQNKPFIKPDACNFSQNAPPGRGVSQGVYSQGYCPNCRGKKVCNWGFGNFPHYDIAIRSKCPLCQYMLKQINTIGLFKSCCFVFAQRKEQTEMKLLRYEYTDGNSSWELKNLTGVEWASLKLSVLTTKAGQYVKKMAEQIRLQIQEQRNSGKPYKEKSIKQILTVMLNNPERPKSVYMQLLRQRTNQLVFMIKKQTNEQND